MKAKDLAALLLQHPEADVKLMGDPEGNETYEVGSVMISNWVEKTDDMYPLELSHDLRDSGFTQEDIDRGKKEGKPLFQLWPKDNF